MGKVVHTQTWLCLLVAVALASCGSPTGETGGQKADSGGGATDIGQGVGDTSGTSDSSAGSDGTDPTDAEVPPDTLADTDVLAETDVTDLTDVADATDAVDTTDGTGETDVQTGTDVPDATDTAGQSDVGPETDTTAETDAQPATDADGDTDDTADTDSALSTDDTTGTDAEEADTEPADNGLADAQEIDGDSAGASDTKTFDIISVDGLIVCAGDDYCPDTSHCQFEGESETGFCVPDLCSPGNGVCAGNATAACNEAGSGWTTPSPCPTGSTCVQNNGAANCTPWLCTPGVSCDGNAVQTCSTNGLTVTATTPCGSDSVCVGGSCVPLVCTPGEVVCHEGAIATCNTTGLGVTDPVPCQDGSYCKATAGAAPVCTPMVCTPGEGLCEGDQPTTCKPDGSGPGALAEACSANGQVCSAGQCVALVCDPLQPVYCKDNAVHSCDLIGLNSTWVQDCASGTYCSDGACLPQVCTPNEIKCVDGKPVSCDAVGGSQTSGAVCNDGLPCTADSCVAGEGCKADLTTCGGANPLCAFAPNPAAGEPGAPCTGPTDCHSGACVTGENGSFCSRPCGNCCPEGLACGALDGVVGNVCLPATGRLCRPCKQDKDCNETGGSAICLDYGPEGQFCGSACTKNSDCPLDFTCKAAFAGGKLQCIRKEEAGLCPCSAAATAVGAETSCSTATGMGACMGVRQCTAGGLSECTAAEPATEVCNGLDDDCDGFLDEQDAEGCTQFYADSDGDQWGGGAGACLCEANSEFVVSKGDDCDDQDASVYPGAKEYCSDAVDNDCSGTVDDVDAVGCAVWYADKDGDTFGTAAESRCLCPGAAVVAPYTVSTTGDCADDNPAVYPGATEVCDSMDNDCNGGTDEQNSVNCTTWYIDGDLDTYGSAADSRCLCASSAPYLSNNANDCNDADGLIRPNAIEKCDTIDNDCDGNTDEENALSCKPLYLDSDGDTFGVTGAVKCLCTATAPYTATKIGDCDDSSAANKPGAAEMCGDAVDNNCNNQTDEDGAANCTNYYEDKDTDGYGETASTICACAKRGAYTVSVGGDCADDDETTNPGETEYCDGVDNNCVLGADEENSADCASWFADKDTDGHPGGTPRCLCSPDGGYESTESSDCNDGNAAIYPGATEACNGQDDNCNGVTDADGFDTQTFYQDKDGDGWGSAVTASLCVAYPPFTATQTGDCNDAEALTFPAAQEVCNGQDDNCDGATDEFGAKNCTNYYIDKDGDGWGIGAPACMCGSSDVYTATKTGDCDDNANNRYPGRAETCGDGVDSNCNEDADEPGAAGCQPTYADADGDSWGNSAVSMCLCSGDTRFPVYKVTQGGDCNDNAPNIKPGATEVCDGYDNNCAGGTDEADAVGCVIRYADSDGDNFGNTAQSQCVCGNSPPYVATAGDDCNDNSPAVYPGASEKCDGLDNNCSGTTDEENATGCKDYAKDGDGDGYGVTGDVRCLCTGVAPYTATATGDCNDASVAANPGKTETCGDNIDNDCDFGVDEVGASGCAVYYEDKDNDGIGIGDATSCLCAPLGAYKALVAGDCNDTDNAVAPGLPEICDAKDNNCDGNTDPANATGCTQYYEDIDMDSYGKTVSKKCLCVPNYPFTAGNGGDCNDNQGAIYPNQYEFCNGKDDNCNGQTDTDSPDAKIYYVDVDLDGYGGVGRSQCGPDLDYYQDQGGDCNDMNKFVSPGRVETCNGIDDNCNGTTDDGGGVALCPAYDNAIPSCSGSCGSSCKAGFWDLNSAITDGCECTTDSTYGISGGSCGGATALGVLSDTGVQVLSTGNLMPGETGDWYSFTARDEPDESGCDTFRVAANLLANPGGQYAIDVYRGSCSASSMICQGETESTWSTNFYGSEPSGPGALNNPSPVAGPPQPNGPGKHNPSPSPEKGGECPCTTAPGLPGMNLCTDNSAQYYIRVYRVAGIAPTCEDYTLLVSNGIP